MDNVCDFVGCFPFFFILLAVGMPIGIYLYNEERKASWKSLAESNKLTLKPGNLLLRRGTCVFGNYRGHSLKLESIKNSSNDYQNSTRIRVSASYSRLGYISPNEVVSGAIVPTSQLMMESDKLLLRSGKKINVKDIE